MSTKIFVYQIALIRKLHTSFLTTQKKLYEFTELEHKFKRFFVFKNRF